MHASSSSLVHWQQRYRSANKLHLALAVSFVVHALLLLIHFAPLQWNPPKHRDTGLEVVLVNAAHRNRPEQATQLAQANLDGGGNVEHDARPSTPLPALERTQEGNALIEARKRVETLEAAQQKLLTQTKAKASIAPPREKPLPPQTQEIKRPTGLDLYDSAQAIARLEAQIDKQLDEYAKRPKKKFLGAQVSEYRYAQYVESWRQKVERIGTLNYPEAARGKLYGNLLLTVAIRADGTLERVDINRSSGFPLLDEAARRIVQMAAPYAPFPPDIRKDTDIIEITRTWTFTNSDQLSTR